MTGNIGSSSSRPINEQYLTSAIGGTDRASQNTIDESVWTTIRRDLLASWSKMREVLYPKYLFGGSMLDNTTTLRSAYEGFRAGGFASAREEVRGIAGRVMDSENLLSQANMSPGLRDWDLWGPLVFCLALSLLLSFNARSEQKSVVFSGVFAMVWIGEAVVTAQIKLLGGNMFVTSQFTPSCCNGRLLTCLDRLPSLSASSAIRSSRLSLRRCYQHCIYQPFHESQYTLFSSAGL